MVIRASEQASAFRIFNVENVLHLRTDTQQPIPYCVIVYFSIVIRLLLLARMLDASGIHAQHRQTQTTQEMVDVCAFVAPLLFPLLQTLFACIIKSCNKIVVVVSVPFCSRSAVDGRVYGDVFIPYLHTYTHTVSSFIFRTTIGRVCASCVWPANMP